MYWGLNIRVVGVIAATVILFTSGWVINGWRWNAKMQTLVVAQERARADAEQKARALEQFLNARATTERNHRDAEIKVIRTQLADALNELRKRPSRVSVPTVAGSPATGTGAQLLREDAEFLAREAARADEIRTDLLVCTTLYNEARNALRK